MPLRRFGERFSNEKFLDFSAWVRWQAGPHLKALRQLETGNALAKQKLRQFGECHAAARPGHHHGTTGFAKPRMRNSHDRHRVDRWMRREIIFNLANRNILSSADDDILEPAGDADRTIGELTCEVARMVPTVRVKVLCRQFRLAKITKEGIRPARPFLADLA